MGSRVAEMKATTKTVLRPNCGRASQVSSGCIQDSIGKRV